MNSGKWSAIQVPSHWEFQGFGAFNYGQNEKVFNDEKGLYKYQFLHLFTPQPAKFVKGGVMPPLPSGNISILNGICAIGTKFTKAEAKGPQSQLNEHRQDNEPLSGKLFFRFGE